MEASSFHPMSTTEWSPRFSSDGAPYFWDLFTLHPYCLPDDRMTRALTDDAEHGRSLRQAQPPEGTDNRAQQEGDESRERDGNWDRLPQ